MSGPDLGPSARPSDDDGPGPGQGAVAGTDAAGEAQEAGAGPTPGTGSGSGPEPESESEPAVAGSESGPVATGPGSGPDTGSESEPAPELPPAVAESGSEPEPGPATAESGPEPAPATGAGPTPDSPSASDSPSAPAPSVEPTPARAAGSASVTGTGTGTGTAPVAGGDSASGSDEVAAVEVDPHAGAPAGRRERGRWRPARPSRPVLLTGTAVLAAAAVAGIAVAASYSSPDRHRTAATADGLPHTTVQVSGGACGRGWDHPVRGKQVFDVHNSSGLASEVYLTDPKTKKVYGEVEDLGPNTTRALPVVLGGGSYAFMCVPDDAQAVVGPTVRVSGPPGGNPAAVPVTEHDLVPPTLAYSKWIASRMGTLVDRTDALRDAVHRGDLGAARDAWLPAHLAYERMGAAYDTFGDADGKINGTTAGLNGGVHDPDFTGFHRVEYGLWHGQSASTLRGPVDRLDSDVRKLRSTWSQQRMDPLDLGLRAHEILENTVQFELTGRTDYGSGTNLATARANLDGTRTVLHYLHPLLKTRTTALPEIDSWLDRTQHVLDAQHHGDRWTPLHDLSRTEREKLNAAMNGLVERLAKVAALTDVRRTR